MHISHNLLSPAINPARLNQVRKLKSSFSPSAVTCCVHIFDMDVYNVLINVYLVLQLFRNYALS